MADYYEYFFLSRTELVNCFFFFPNTKSKISNKVYWLITPHLFSSFFFFIIIISSFSYAFDLFHSQVQNSSFSLPPSRPPLSLRYQPSSTSCKDWVQAQNLANFYLKSHRSALDLYAHTLGSRRVMWSNGCSLRDFVLCCW
jgi:hypothetical protein